eukprot:TRINITY_DN3600_c0_g1_i4.p1 TRINITY_DN3600_c0_g1~~TRINITY_DN3600_c0_g1_i4.p1  ORF type:complete len:439 (-),score=46.94 TRINITY_DN3600_c0_g1_i4:279-1442(-)
MDTSQCVGDVEQEEIVKDLSDKKPNILDIIQNPKLVQTENDNRLTLSSLKRKLRQDDGTLQQEQESKRQKLLETLQTRAKITPDTKKADTEILFIGTGCANPSKYRGPSAILLRFYNQYSVLLECGEGTWQSFVRHFRGTQGALETLNSLLCIWLSHKHLDHVAGLPTLLEHRFAQNRPIVVIAPNPIHKWMKTTYLQLYKYHKFQFIGSFKLDSIDAIGHPLARIQSVPVIHCHDSYGVAIQLINGTKIVFSGDTRPCQKLVDIGYGCDLLIHEATFEDDLLDHAINKGHSTVLEAVRIAKRMKSKACILTHFSQRYSNTPIDVTQEGTSGCFGAAFDGMWIKLSELDQLPKFTQLLNYICKDEEDEEEELKNGKDEISKFDFGVK